MNEPHIQIPPAELADLFPFHLATDDHLEIVQMGRVMRRLHPDIAPGAPLTRHFWIDRPRVDASYDELSRRCRQVFVLDDLSLRVHFRGQMLPLPESRELLFLGSPMVTDARDLARIGVGIKDVALHDQLLDHLFANNSLRVALDDAAEFARRLEAKSRELERSNRALRRAYARGQPGEPERGDPSWE